MRTNPSATTDPDVSRRHTTARRALSTGKRNVAGARRATEFDKSLALLGLLGLALAAIVFSVILVRGNTFIAPEGDLEKSLTFNAALGIYYLTLAFFLPLARFSPGARRRWLGAVAFIALYSYGVETIQIFRGIDPRFSEAGSTWDQTFGIVFGITALAQIVVFLILALRLFRRSGSLVILALWYAAGATMLAFAAGIWMSAIGSRAIGEDGSLLPLHALGFHALQAIPLLGWLLERSTLPNPTSRRLIHVAGAGWIAACLAVTWQTQAGRSVFEPSLAVFVTLVMLVMWGGLFLVAARAWQTALPR